MASFQIARKNGRVYTVLVDDDDLSRVLAAGPWQIQPPKIERYTAYVIKKMIVAGRRQTVRLHRFVMGVIGEAVDLDHANGDGLDCRRANLRPATDSQNACNRRTRSDNGSGFKGVYWKSERQRWRAEITLGGRTRSLGDHKTPELAHAAYLRASTDLHGKFSRPG